MYPHNSSKHGWWDEVRLIVWGPSAPLLVGDAELQERIKAMIEDGVHVMACKYCADSYGISEALADLGIEVVYIGQPLTEMLQSGWTSLTF